MQDSVGLERLYGVDESEAAMQAEPFSGVAMPLDVEAIPADPVEARERGIELLAEIVRKAGAIALDESIVGAAPFAENVDRVIKLRRADHMQEPADQSLVSCA